MSERTLAILAKAVVYGENLQLKTVYDEAELLVTADKNIQPRFTVIGSPLDRHDVDGGDLKGKERTWRFEDPTAMILGLQGVHHSEAHPVWMDMVCQ